MESTAFLKVRSVGWVASPKTLAKLQYYIYKKMTNMDPEKTWLRFWAIFPDMYRMT